jgi:hypothetical protein
MLAYSNKWSEVIFKFVKKQILKKDLKRVLFTCYKKIGPKVTGPAHFEVQYFFLFWWKIAKTSKFVRFQIFSHAFYWRWTLTLNPHVIYAHTFHIKKLAIYLHWICLGSVFKKGECFLLNTKYNRKLLFYSTVQLYFLYLKIPKLPMHGPLISTKNSM